MQSSSHLVSQTLIVLCGSGIWDEAPRDHAETYARHHLRAQEAGESMNDPGSEHDLSETGHVATLPEGGSASGCLTQHNSGEVCWRSSFWSMF